MAHSGNGSFSPSNVPHVGVESQQVQREPHRQDPWQLPISLQNSSPVSRPLRILIADAHEVVRLGVRSILESHPGWLVCGEACDGWDAVAKTAELEPDLVVMDVGMPRLNGVEAARRILLAAPGTAILILTIYDSEEIIRQVLNVGARGFVLKSDAATSLVLAVDALAGRATFFTSRAAQIMLDSVRQRAFDGTARPQLTPRQREVVQLVAEGKSNKEIAVALNMSVKTVETHRTAAMRNLGLHSIAGVVRYAVSNSMIQIS